MFLFYKISYCFFTISKQKNTAILTLNFSDLFGSFLHLFYALNRMILTRFKGKKKDYKSLLNSNNFYKI